MRMALFGAAVAVGVLAASTACGVVTDDEPERRDPPAPAEQARPTVDFPSAFAWATRNLLGVPCRVELTEQNDYRWEHLRTLADYGTLGVPDTHGDYHFTAIPVGYAINGRPLPLPAGTSRSTTLVVNPTQVITMTSTPTGEGMEWSRLAFPGATVEQVAAFPLRLAQRLLVEPATYSCGEGAGAWSGSVDHRTPATPDLEVVWPDGRTIPILSIGF